eukprot:6890957-Prymnesium_polylepis.1
MPPPCCSHPLCLSLCPLVFGVCACVRCVACVGPPPPALPPALCRSRPICPAAPPPRAHCTFDPPLAGWAARAAHRSSSAVTSPPRPTSRRAPPPSRPSARAQSCPSARGASSGSARSDRSSPRPPSPARRLWRRRRDARYSCCRCGTGNGRVVWAEESRGGLR